MGQRDLERMEARTLIERDLGRVFERFMEGVAIHRLGKTSQVDAQFTGTVATHPVTLTEASTGIIQAGVQRKSDRSTLGVNSSLEAPI
jgi:hypothetical protein